MESGCWTEGVFITSLGLVAQQSCHLDRSEAQWRDLRSVF
jgi:hypothetical protein